MLRFCHLHGDGGWVVFTSLHAGTRFCMFHFRETQTQLLCRQSQTATKLLLFPQKPCHFTVNISEETKKWNIFPPWHEFWVHQPGGNLKWMKGCILFLHCSRQYELMKQHMSPGKAIKQHFHQSYATLFHLWLIHQLFHYHLSDTELQSDSVHSTLYPDTWLTVACSL